MEKQIKTLIIKGINSGNIPEAMKLIKEYEELFPLDSNIYNFKAMCYISKNEPQKAFQVLQEGLIEHPKDFELLFNLGYVNEQLGEFLQALDIYLEAMNYTADNKNKKDIKDALDRVKAAMKKQVVAAKKGLIDIHKTNIASGADAKHDTTMVDVEIDKCRDQYAFGYGHDAWNPFVETLKEIIADPKIPFEACSLKRFYFQFRPKTLQEVLIGEENIEVSPINKGWYPYPWGDYNYNEKIQAIKKKQHPHFGPYPDEQGKMEMRNLKAHYNVLKETGYHPHAFQDSYISGYVLKTKDDYRFVVCRGNHRVAALAALGYEKIRCRILNNKKDPSIVDIQAVSKWHNVQRELYTKNAASKVFHTFFKNNGRERAIEADLVCDDVDPNIADSLRKVGVNLKSRLNVKFHNAGLLNTVDEDFAREVQEYWLEHYDQKIDPGFHLAYMNYTGKKDVRLVPHDIMRGEIIPLSNDRDMERIGYRDKNMYDRLIPTSRTPKTILKRVCGKYFDGNHNVLDQKEAYNAIVSPQEDLIIKPTYTNDGIGIAKLNILGEHIYLEGKVMKMPDLEKKWGLNFIVQEALEQHPVVSKPHPSSVNALRMVTYRWKKEIKNIAAFAKFGSGNRVLNNTAPISCGIKDSGELFKYALDNKANVHTHHPTTNYCFADYAKIPNYEKFKKFVRDLHKEVLHHDYICWDIIVGVDGEPIFLELNFWGTTWIYQMCYEAPFFTDYTEEVLASMKNKKENKK